MRHRGKLLVGVLSAVMVVAVGCGEQGAPTLPETTAPAKVQVSRAGTQRLVKALARNSELKGNLSVTKRIGAQGGVIVHPGSGLRVTVPAGALPLSPDQRYIDITVSAIPGSSLAYNFEPHGLVFRTPIHVEQALTGTAFDGNRNLAASMRGAYFEGDILDGAANVLEERPTTVDVTRRQLSFWVEHFSGYLVAVG
jgi:hypothetical protein